MELTKFKESYLKVISESKNDELKNYIRAIVEEVRDSIESIKEDAVDFLRKYVNDPMNRWISAKRFDEILSYFPYQGGKLHRGMNFLDRESYEKFIEDMKDGIVKTQSITSWSRDFDTASQFAITRPTYYFNSVLASAESARQKSGEYMIGYRGVILTTVVPAEVGIDVSESGVGVEDEVILPVGNYKVQISKEFKPFAQQVAGRDPNELIQSISQEQFRSQEEYKKLFHFLLTNNKPENFSSASKQHIFHLLYRKPYTLGNIVYDDPVTYFGYCEVHHRYNFEPFGYTKYFLDQDLKKLRKDADLMLNDVSKTLKPKLAEFGISVVDVKLSIRHIEWILKMASPGAISKYSNVIKSIVAPEKQKLDLSVRDINKITDSKQKSKAIDDYKEKMTRLIHFAS